jgi:RHS repeat-associated protein
VFFNGKRVARVDMPGNSPKYYFEDHLGSTDIVTNPTGGIVEESDYVPYGGEIVISGTDPNHYKFSGKERDPESGLDDFEARHYSSGFGRFMQADEFAGGPTDLFDSDDPASSVLPYADITDPQSLNKYAYTYNNPLRYTDPNGHCPECAEAGQELAQVVEAVPPPARPILALPPVATGVLIGVAVGTGINALANHVQSKADQQMAHEKELNRAKIKEAEEKQAEPQASADGAKKKGGGQKPVDPNAGKKADDLISGSLKHSKSYHGALGGLTKQEILDRAAKGDKKAQQMKKLIEQQKRLVPKRKKS